MHLALFVVFSATNLLGIGEPSRITALPSFIASLAWLILRFILRAAATDMHIKSTAVLIWTIPQTLVDLFHLISSTEEIPYFDQHYLLAADKGASQAY